MQRRNTDSLYYRQNRHIYSRRSAPITENTEFITDVIEECGDELKDAILKGKWDAFSDKVYELISARYEKYRISNDGEVVDGSHNLWTWNKDTLPSRMGDIFTYRFEYDARRDPCAIADDLNEYIEAIKEKTGYDKIHLISRCLGCNIASAYLAEYGWDDILTNVFFASAANGYDFVGEMFAGKFGFKSGAIARYEDDTFNDEDEITNELVKAALAYADKSGILPVGTGVGTLIYKAVSEKVVPRLVVSTYGTCPGYWAMVNHENYEEAKQFLFGDEVNTTYKKLVEKIDNYHYNVQQKLRENLLSMKNDGCKINIICKYGFQMPPFIESSEALSDNRIEVVEQSFGATTTEVDKTFSLVYMNKAKKNGTVKYISPDKKIDSSTALFPDYSWYIKNIVHNPFYDCFNLLMLEMCYGDEQMTIDSDPIWPQYLFYDNTNSTCVPLTSDNMGSDDYYTTNYFEALIRLCKALIAFLKMRLSK